MNSVFPLKRGTYRDISYKELTWGKYLLFSIVCLIECVPGHTIKKKKKKKGIGEDKEIANDVLFSLDCDLENAWINYQFFFRLEKIYIQI